MATSRIKGITVENGGDITKLQTALKGVNSSIRKVLTNPHFLNTIKDDQNIKVSHFEVSE